ncbi:type II toxin-antitoxin system VapC family toxin [Longimicrobium sp.]|uniref:type II toxin-antitoxin system VapC family toxin n=1 Tax=Longimicrobium sp. TaxID=2029185 RepID=UPI002E33F0C9|nr:PIN domain-containing protein [Longimicrobium sp.]HEX6038193.1 PIN domain-containing protein [Longimicrobium sp.]
MATPGAEVFLDASYVIALAIPADEAHERAVERADWLRRNPEIGLVTTQPVLLEIGNMLAKYRFRDAAVAVLDTVAQDPRIHVIPLTDDLYADALSLFRQRKDKEWGMTDCVSFVVMQRRQLREALTTDHHFEQAGFRALMR